MQCKGFFLAFRTVRFLKPVRSEKLYYPLVRIIFWVVVPHAAARIPLLPHESLRVVFIKLSLKKTLHSSAHSFYTFPSSFHSFPSSFHTFPSSLHSFPSSFHSFPSSLHAFPSSFHAFPTKTYNFKFKNAMVTALLNDLPNN